MLPVIAIVGRPNVGKSALFNRIVGKRIAIVHDEAGITRDRISVDTEWNGVPFTLLDTGGIGLVKGEQTSDEIVTAMRQQARVAIQDAALIVLVVDSRDGVVPLDHEVVRQLRESGKLIFLAVNKVDSEKQQNLLVDFLSLGFKKVFPVSAIQGFGVDEMLDEAVKILPADLSEAGAQTPKTEVPLKIAIVGRPNVGKSSLVNRLVRADRVIVSDMPGTTRDSVDVPFSVEVGGETRPYVLIDTAGIRPRKKVDTSVEFFSVRRAELSIERCDLAVLVLDATFGVSAQDKKIGGKILAANKGCILAVNKWDLIGEKVQKDFIEQLHHILFFLDFAQVVFVSAKTGQGLSRLISAVHGVDHQLSQSITTGLLNRNMADAISARHPPARSGHRLKFFYATQVGTRPPHLLLFVNRPDLFTSSYRKYLSDRLRAAFGFQGCPIVISARARERIEPKKTEQKNTPRRHLKPWTQDQRGKKR
ncbi:MAG: ribosome biogenesis GTPase Der [Verrucomicrobiia bacterium]